MSKRRGGSHLKTVKLFDFQDGIPFFEIRKKWLRQYIGVANFSNIPKDERVDVLQTQLTELVFGIGTKCSCFITQLNDKPNYIPGKLQIIQFGVDCRKAEVGCELIIKLLCERIEKHIPINIDEWQRFGEYRSTVDGFYNNQIVDALMHHMEYNQKKIGG